MLHFWLPLLVALCSLSVLLGAPLPNERREDARTGLLNALRNANLNQFAQALSANSGVLDAIVSSPGKKFILGPTDEAMASLPRWVTRHQEVLQSTLLHHVLNGSFDPNSFVGPPLHTLGHSLLTSDKHVQLPGGNGQAVAMGKAENGTFVAEAVNQDRFQAGTSTWNEFQIQPIQHAITIPGNLTQTLSFLGFKDLIDLLNSVQSGALTQQLDSMSGLTLFVPIPSAIQSFRNAIVPNGNFDNQSGNGKVSPDQVATILGQHVIQGRVLYSPLLADQGSIITSSGQDLSFDKRSLTVRVGDQSARVVQSDIMMRTGVIHLIDKVLINTNLDSARGQQAARSAQAVVPHTVSGPISATNAATSAGDQVPGPNANNGGSSNRNDSSWGYHPGNGNGNGNGNGKNGAGVSLTKGATSASAIGFATLAGLAVLAF